MSDTGGSNYSLLEEESQTADYRIGTRTESAALLAWFLRNVWLVEPEDVDDSICDGGGDKGIDALVVDEEQSEITIFQSKHRKAADAGQGDADIKNLYGASMYFVDTSTVDGLLASKPNPELRALLLRLRVRDRVAEGAHTARLVFVTNGTLDLAGQSYVDSMSSVTPPLEVWDQARLGPVAFRVRRPSLRPENVRLTSSGAPTRVDLTPSTPMAIGVVPASELVLLPGIDDLSLFDRNVRLSEGRTRINKELAATIADRSEHALFPAYHNGLTLLTNGLTVHADGLELDGVAVVNGCQSLLTLREHRSEISDQLNLLVKVVQVEADTRLSDAITYRTNNQNPVDIRDQRSSDPKQRALQAEVAAHYGGQFAYSIRQGERFPKGLPIFDNQSAAQLLMATYLGEPWNAVRKVRLFDQDYRRIFGRSVSAHRLFLLWRLGDVLYQHRTRLRPDLQASYASVRMTLAHLVAEMLRETAEGQGLLESPDRWLPDLDGAVFEKIGSLADEVIDSVNASITSEELERREKDEDFDPKVYFKSERGVRAVSDEVLRMSRRLAMRDEDYFFSIDPVR